MLPRFALITRDCARVVDTLLITRCGVVHLYCRGVVTHLIAGVVALPVVALLRCARLLVLPLLLVRIYALIDAIVALVRGIATH